MIQSVKAFNQLTDMMGLCLSAYHSKRIDGVQLAWACAELDRLSDVSSGSGLVVGEIEVDPSDLWGASDPRNGIPE